MYTDKYVALAYNSPYGQLIQLKVESKWNKWIELLKKNNIYQNFCRNGYGKTVESCAEDIYAAAIWGYGVSNWIEGRKDPEIYCDKIFFKGCPTRDIKHLKGPNNTPLCFYLLDQWLESLCRELCNDYLSLIKKI